MTAELTKFIIDLAIVGAGLIILGVGLESYLDYLKKHKRLHIIVRKLDDGRYYVRYYWNAWEPTHREYIQPELLRDELGELIEKSLKES